MPLTGNRNDAQLNLRLAADLKRIIEEAALHLGQSVSDFAVSTLAQTARNIIHQRNVTELSTRDRSVFLAMLDDSSTKPHRALRGAAKNYREQVSSGGA